jgi:hypothetical protein
MIEHRMSFEPTIVILVGTIILGDQFLEWEVRRQATLLLQFCWYTWIGLSRDSEVFCCDPA